MDEFEIYRPVLLAIARAQNSISKGIGVVERKTVNGLPHLKCIVGCPDNVDWTMLILEQIVMDAVKETETR